MPFALQGGHEPLRRLWSPLHEPLQGPLAPRLPLLCMCQRFAHPPVALALKPLELGCPGVGCGYLLLAGLTGSLAVFIASISTGLSASATARESTVGGTLGPLSQSQNPSVSTAAPIPLITVSP